MRCGVLCDSDGKVMRSWMLVSDVAPYEPGQAGEEIVEWEADHGGYEHNEARHKKIIARVEQERQEVGELRTKDEALAHNWKRARLVQIKTRPAIVNVTADVVLPSPPV